ncbi:hypothetical protein DPMN_004427 [Dreissena polymorpha]|uniref:Uncharacterized protein n=1 Tax=Dreissena polymorpha TaxID=45954 RepID=A0A9D4MRQ2_DREPO|nr:hypothetical protein DPMN_004427 [Dreissena polymorpha]
MINKLDIFQSGEFFDTSDYHSNLLHVTNSGQVLVCELCSNKLFQVDNEGRQLLAEVVTQKDGVIFPTSVFYSKHRAALIVGMFDRDDILVFKT